MPTVHFYKLSSNSQQQRLAFVCRWADRLYQRQETVYIAVDNADTAQQLDEMLWTFKADSFIPHQRYNGQLPLLAHTLLIGGTPVPESRQTRVFNLNTTAPAVGAGCDTLYEVVDNDAAWLAASRQRYRHYTQQGWQLKTHIL
jgi:DNA polymerase-3 subunit chi